MTGQTDRRNGETGALAIKTPARLFLDANVALAGLQTLQGVALADGDRVVAGGQTDATARLIYVASSGNWTAAKDFDDAYDFTNGTMVRINAGTYAGGVFACTVSADPPVVGTSTVSWAAVIGLSVSPLSLALGGTGGGSAIAGRESMGAIGNITRNLTFNGDFELWGLGTAVAPTGWTLAGASAAAAKNTTAGQFRYGASAVSLTRAGADATLTQDIDTIAGVGPIGAWKSRKVTVGAWVYCATAAIARVGINDGVTTTWSSYHPGDGAFHFLTATATLAANATRARFTLSVDTTNGTGVFDGAIIVEGGVLTDWVESIADRDRYNIFLGSITAQGTSVTNYYSVHGTSTTEVDVQMTMPHNCVLKNAYLALSAAQGASSQWAVTLRKNAADGNIAITLGSTVASGSDTTNNDYFAAGDKLAAKAVTNGSVTSAKFHLGLEVVRVPL